MSKEKDVTIRQGRVAESATPFVRLEKSAVPFERKSAAPQGMIPGTVSIEAAIAAAQAEAQSGNAASSNQGGTTTDQSGS